MVIFEIDGERRVDNDITEPWITQQYRNARESGHFPCVKVQIDTADCKLNFATASCGPRGGGGRELTKEEQRMVLIWEQSGLTEAEFPPGHIVSFLKRIQQFC